MKKTILFISVGLFIGLVSRAHADPPAANQILWLKADAGVLTNGSGTVTNWLDQSSNNNNALLSTGYGDPKAAVTDFGLPSDHDVVRFDGNDGLRLTSDAALRATNISIYSVCYLPTASGPQGTDTMIASFTSCCGWLQAIQGAGNVYFFTTGVIGSPTVGPDGAYSGVQGNIWACVTTTLSTSTGAKKIRVDGVEKDSRTGKGVTLHTLATATVGYYGAGLGFFVGDIAEILVYDSVDTNQQAQVEEYLYDKYWAAPETVETGSLSEF